MFLRCYQVDSGGNKRVPSNSYLGQLVHSGPPSRLPLLNGKVGIRK